MDMIKLMRKTVYLMLLMGIVQIVSFCSIIFIPERKNNKSQKYALLIGGGITESDNFEFYYKNVEYAANTLKKLGYCDEDIKTLFFGGKTANHPIVEGNATKENFIYELRHLGQTIDSNDSLVIFRSGHGIVKLILEKYPNNKHGLEIESIKCVGTEAVMRFPDGDLSHLEFQEILDALHAGKWAIGRSLY